MKKGDLVVRSSYNKDVTFKIIDIYEKEGKNFCLLKGKDIRILADCFESDLEVVEVVEKAEPNNVSIMADSKVKNKIKSVLAKKNVLRTFRLDAAYNLKNSDFSVASNNPNEKKKL